MIKTQRITIGDREFIKTFSNRGLKIERDGVKYSSATDLPQNHYTYVETDEPIFPAKEWEKLPEEAKRDFLESIGAGQEQIILA